MNWQYTARLVPLDVRVCVPSKPDREPWYYTFSAETFAGEPASKRVIPVCDDHQRHLVIGKVDRLIAHLGWWECEMTLAADQPELERGTPVSIGLQTIGICGDTPFITEVSVVPHGAVDGAVVRNRRLLPQPAKPEPPKPTVASTPTRAPVAHPRTAATRTQHDEERWAEVSRRMDRIERLTGRPANMEDVLAAMHLELHGPTLDELYAKHVLNRRAA